MEEEKEINDCEFCDCRTDEHIRVCCEKGKKADQEKNWKNMAKCKKCLDIVESKFRHDFVRCSCGEIFVDGGNAYWRAGATDLNNFERIWEER